MSASLILFLTFDPTSQPSLLVPSLTLPFICCSSGSVGPETLQQGCGLLVHWRHHLHIVSRSLHWLSSWEISEQLILFLPSPILAPQATSTFKACACTHVHPHTYTHSRTHPHTHTYHAHSSKGFRPGLHQVITIELSVNPLFSHMVLSLPAPHLHLVSITALSPALWNEQ